MRSGLPIIGGDTDMVVAIIGLLAEALALVGVVVLGLMLADKLGRFYFLPDGKATRLIEVPLGFGRCYRMSMMQVGTISAVLFFVGLLL